MNLKVIALIDNGFEDLELWYPYLRLKEEKIQVSFVGNMKNEKYIGKYGVPAISEFSFDEINSIDFDGILIPGGWAPDKLRRDDRVLKVVYQMNENNKVIGQICHAGWVSISAGIVKGKKVTSTPGIRDDLTNAGAFWFDKPVIVDNNLISARRPPDLPFYLIEFIKAIKGLKD